MASDKFREHRRNYMQEWRKNNPTYSESRRRSQRKWAAANRHKTAAHSKVQYAIKQGVLVRPETCSRCGAGGRIEATHVDYGRPLDVEWLCRLCHMEKDGLR